MILYNRGDFMISLHGISKSIKRYDIDICAIARHLGNGLILFISESEDSMYRFLIIPIRLLLLPKYNKIYHNDIEYKIITIPLILGYIDIRWVTSKKIANLMRIKKDKSNYEQPIRR